MNKCIKIILCNLFIIAILLGLLEFGLYFNYKRIHPEIKYEIREMKYDNAVGYYNFRPVQGKGYKKPPIILAGCSFAYGMGLKENETLGYKLAEITKRPVYNIAMQGKGLQHNLYMLQNKLYDKSINNPEYFIYVIMSDQIRRLYSPVCLHDFIGYPEYIFDKNNNLILKNNIYPIYKQFYVYYFFKNLYYSYIGYKNYSEHSKWVNAYFKEMKKEINKEFPNTKFVILFYGDYKKYYGLDLTELEKENIIMLHTQDLSPVNIYDREYRQSETDYHPNEKIWDILTPLLAKELNI